MNWSAVDVVLVWAAGALAGALAATHWWKRVFDKAKGQPPPSPAALTSPFRDDVVAFLLVAAGPPTTSYSASSEPKNLFGTPLYKLGHNTILMVGRDTFIVAMETSKSYAHVYRWEYDSTTVSKLESFLNSLGPGALKKP